MRWQEFPDIISDDTFVRLHFEPDERIEVPSAYHWPMVEGFSNLVKVRRRQDAGVDQMRNLYPQIMIRENKAKLGIAGKLALLLRDPVGFVVYSLVHISVRLKRPTQGWTRGR